MIKINFEDIYPVIQIADDFSFMTFHSPDKKGVQHILKIEITFLEDPFLPNVFNLSFGPIADNGEIDDEAKINHSDIDKMFSTILFFGLVFLEANPENRIGIDGSNDVRAYLYHRMFITNKGILSKYFVTFGVDWYVRMFRSGNIETDSKGHPFFKPKPESFDYLRPTADLYRYYMFSLTK